MSNGGFLDTLLVIASVILIFLARYVIIKLHRNIKARKIKSKKLDDYDSEKDVIISKEEMDEFYNSFPTSNIWEIPIIALAGIILMIIGLILKS